MKQLTCEMCGSTDLIKQDGVFVCQTCGCKYSIEEARKMMVEGTVEVVGTVKVDNTAAIENYLDMARNALDAKNLSEADNYCNKIIEMDVANWEAWFIKGKAVGWQSTLRNIRVAETINAFSKAINNCPEEQREKLGEACKKEIDDLQTALLTMSMKYFKNHPSEQDLADLISNVQTIITTSRDFLVKAHIITDWAIYPRYARIINNGICDAWKIVYKNYVGDENHPSDYDLTRFISEGDVLIGALKFALSFCQGLEESTKEIKVLNELVLNELNELKIQIYKNLIDIQEKIIESKSYEVSFEGGSKHYKVSKCLSKESKKGRQAQISDWQAEISEARLTSIQKDAEAARKRREKYWEEHKEEREKLEEEQERLKNEKDQLNSQIDETVKNKTSVPAQLTLNTIHEKISMLRQQKQSLGLFKGKEKKALQEEIDSAEREAAEVQKQVDIQQAPLEAKASQLRAKLKAVCSRLDEINEEFNRER